MKRIFANHALTSSEKNARDYEKHRERRLAYNRLYHQLNKAKVAKRHRLYHHGMTQEEHDQRLQEQQNCCAICRKPFIETPHIDHNHETGQNRGLLCEDCNLGLGRFKDSIEILSNAIQYLEKWNESKCA